MLDDSAAPRYNSGTFGPRFMNEYERTELERLKQRHARLENEISLLRTQLATLENKLSAPPAVELTPPQRRPTSEILHELQQEPVEAIPTPPPEIPITEPALEAVMLEPIPAPPIIEQFSAPVFAHTETAALEPEVVEPPIFVPPPPCPAEPSLATKGSFEMRLGTYWFVRIGVVLIVTALVFLGNYAYQNFIANFGAPGKISLLYLASGLLLGAGAWWQRKVVKESLRNYAQVLFAGGLAAIYFTTYAAHHIPHLRVIESPLLDGVLLSAWAAFIAWIADRKKSEVLAFFAVGLAYYSSVITRVGDFTLYSNLVLTLVAVGFLVRNRWAVLSSASLLATYGSYAYWRFYNGAEGWHWPDPQTGLWFGVYFLMCYWLVFTTAVFLSKHPKLAGANRATFLTLNNGAFFALFLMTMFHVRVHGFWKFSLGYGSLLLALSVIARRLLPDDAPTRQSYLTQGLVLVTVGFVAKFSGLDLALTLAAESVVLFFLSTLRKNLIIELGSYTSGAMAVAWSLEGIKQFDSRGLWLGSALGAMMMFNAFWSHRQQPPTQPNQFRLVPGYFAALALMIWFFTTWQNTAHANIGLVLTLEALLLTLSIYLLRMPEVAVLGQGYIFLAQLAWAYAMPKGSQQLTALALGAHSLALLQIGWHRKELALKVSAYFVAPLAIAWGIAGLERNVTNGMLTGIALAAMMITKAFFTHRQSIATDENALRPGPSYFSALAIAIAVATTWFNTNQQNCALALVAEGLLLTATIHFLRMRELPLLAQTLVLGGHALWQFNLATLGSPPWWNPLSLIAMTLALGHWWQKQKLVVAQTRVPLVFQFILSLLMVFLVCAWCGRDCEASTWLALACLLAVAFTVYAAAMRMWMLAVCAQIFLLPAGWLFILQIGQGHEPRFTALAPIAALGLLSFAAVQWFKSKPDANAQVREPILRIAVAYRWLALAMSLWWVLEYIPREEHVWTLTLIGAAIFALAGWWKNREALLFGAVFTATAMAVFGVRSFEPDFVYLPSLLAVVAWLAQQQIVRRLPERFTFPEPAHTSAIMAGSLALWIYFTRWVNPGDSGFFLTASWSALALVLFVCGMLLRERMYRWSGLAILACALGRVVIIDVWKLETIYRILSFAALGVVLLVLGFIYNKYQEKIRAWL